MIDPFGADNDCSRKCHEGRDVEQEPDPFCVLGLKRDAEDSEIRSAYKALALKYHPDKNTGNAEAQQMFIQIKNAEETLLDPRKKQWELRFGQRGQHHYENNPYITR